MNQAFGEPIDTRPTQLEELERKELRERLIGELELMSPLEREFILRWAIDEVPVRVIGEFLLGKGSSVREAFYIKDRAIAILAERLNDLMEDWLPKPVEGQRAEVRSIPDSD